MEGKTLAAKSQINYTFLIVLALIAVITVGALLIHAVKRDVRTSLDACFADKLAASEETIENVTTDEALAHLKDAGWTKNGQDYEKLADNDFCLCAITKPHVSARAAGDTITVTVFWHMQIPLGNRSGGIVWNMTAGRTYKRADKVSD